MATEQTILRFVFDPPTSGDYDEEMAYIGAFNDRVIRAQETARDSGNAKTHVLLTYAEPTELWYGRKRRYETATEHQVKEVFPYGVSLCYVPPAMKAKGRRLPYHKLVSVTIVAEVKNYAAEWAAIARSMRKHNVNLGFAQDIEDMLAGRTDYIHGTGWRYTTKHRPKVMSFKDVTRGETLDEMWAQRQPYPRWNQEGPAPVYFARMKRASGTKGGRDRSVHLDWRGPDHEYPNSWYFSAASEYRDCGNGDYYMMISATRAVFVETD